MGRYKKKPIVVDAIQIHGNVAEIEQFIGEHGKVYFDDGAWKIEKGQPCTIVVIHTLEGDMTARDGDYIIKGIKGEFYPCKKDIFEETYEEAEPTKGE